MINAYYLTQEFNIGGRTAHFDKLVVTAYAKASKAYFENLLLEVEQIDPKANEAIIEVLIEQLAKGELSRWEEVALYGSTIITMIASLFVFDSLEVSAIARYLSSTLIAFGTLFIGIRILIHRQLRRVQHTIDFLFDPEKEGCAE